MRGGFHKWVYAFAGLLAIVSIFLPWWSLHGAGGTVTTSQGTRSLASFDFGIGPTGARIAVQFGGQSIPVVDPTGLLSAVSLIIALALFPVSASLVSAFVNGVYCPIRNRRGQRLLVAPLWVVIALFWWFFYFFSLDSVLGGGLQPTGTSNITLGKYTLATVTWGWGWGLWLAVISAILFVIAFGISRWSAGPSQVPVERRMGFHSIGLLFLGVLNLLVGFGLLFVAAILGSFGLAFFALVPAVLLFGMAFLARREVPAVSLQLSSRK